MLVVSQEPPRSAGLPDTDRSAVSVVTPRVVARHPRKARRKAEDMRVIPTTLHGVVDYLTPFTLLVSPKLWKLDEVTLSAATFYLFGTSLTATSLITDYELSMANLVPMRAHLALDAASGAALAASPFALGFRRSGARYWIPHVAVGASEILMAAMTNPERISKRSTLAGAVKAIGRALASVTPTR